MRCFGEFFNDRTCDICKEVKTQTYSDCLAKYKEKENAVGKLTYIKDNCKHRTTCFDEYNEFSGCNKNNKGHGRFAEECVVTLDCEQRCGNENQN